MKKITRKSDKGKLAVPSFQGVAWCPNCHQGKLKEMKGNEFNLKCWECGEETPIKSVKYDTTLTQVDSSPSVVVQNKNRRSRKDRARNPLEQDLITKGFQVITSDWRDQK